MTGFLSFISGKLGLFFRSLLIFFCHGLSSLEICTGYFVAVFSFMAFSLSYSISAYLTESILGLASSLLNFLAFSTASFLFYSSCFRSASVPNMPPGYLNLSITLSPFYPSGSLEFLLIAKVGSFSALTFSSCVIVFNFCFWVSLLTSLSLSYLDIWSASSDFVTYLLKDLSSSSRFFRVSRVTYSSCCSKSILAFLYRGVLRKDFATAGLSSFRRFKGSRLPARLLFLLMLCSKKFLFSSYFFKNSLCLSASSFALASYYSFFFFSRSSLSFFSSSFCFFSRSSRCAFIFYYSACIFLDSNLACLEAFSSLMSNFLFKSGLLGPFSSS